MARRYERLAINRAHPKFPAWPRLEYNGIRFIPHTRTQRDGTVMVFEDRWCVPGGHVYTTAELASRARARGVRLSLFSPTITVLVRGVK